MNLNDVFCQQIDGINGSRLVSSFAAILPESKHTKSKTFTVWQVLHTGNNILWELIGRVWTEISLCQGASFFVWFHLWDKKMSLCVSRAVEMCATPKSFWVRQWTSVEHVAAAKRDLGICILSECQNPQKAKYYTYESVTIIAFGVSCCTLQYHFSIKN